MIVDAHMIRREALAKDWDISINEALCAERDIADFLFAEIVEPVAVSVEIVSQVDRTVVVIITGDDGTTFGRICDLATLQ